MTDEEESSRPTESGSAQGQVAGTAATSATLLPATPFSPTGDVGRDVLGLVQGHPEWMQNYGALTITAGLLQEERAKNALIQSKLEGEVAENKRLTSELGRATTNIATLRQALVTERASRTPRAIAISIGTLLFGIGVDQLIDNARSLLAYLMALAGLAIMVVGFVWGSQEDTNDRP